jgi:hypothetical protein
MEISGKRDAKIFPRQSIAKTGSQPEDVEFNQHHRNLPSESDWKEVYLTDEVNKHEFYSHL